MHKSATINTRIDPKLKHQAESILHGVGLSTAEAIRLFYTQVCLNKGLPFEVKLPNSKTQAAIDQLELGQGARYNSLKDVWDDINDA